MRVVGLAVLEKAKRKHGDLDGPLSSWLKIVEESEWSSFAEMRKTFSTVDSVAGKLVFNVKGNTYRLICTINFASRLIEVEKLLTHAQYDKGGWK